jgi:hypothetical protein
MHQASTEHARANTGSTQRLIDPTIVVHNGRVVKRTGDGAIVEFRRAVDAVRCAIEIKTQWWKATPETTATSWRWRQYRCAIGSDRDARSQSAFPSSLPIRQGPARPQGHRDVEANCDDNVD